MPGAVCKAVICEDKAQGLMIGAMESIDAFGVEDPIFRRRVAEIYIKHMEEATKEVMNYIGGFRVVK